MNQLRILIWMILYFVFFCCIASTDPLTPSKAQSEKPAENDRQSMKTSSSQSPESDFKLAEHETTGKTPVYIPPLRGAPEGRVAGGTRDIISNKAVLRFYAITPDHVGLTLQEQPQLYWFVSGQPPVTIEFALIEAKSKSLVFQTRMKSPERSGFQIIRLADHMINLQLDTQYKWIVAMIQDPNKRSKDIFVGGYIERVIATRLLEKKLQKSDKMQALCIFAEEGIWYDAVSTVSDLIERSPRDKNLRRLRADLLKQVGLTELVDIID